MMTVGKEFETALIGANEAKTCLRVALSPHLRTENKRLAFQQMLRSCPQITRYNEAKAALWLLS